MSDVSKEADPRVGRRSRLFGRLALRSADDVEAADLQSDTVRFGATPIADCVPGERVTVAGAVRSMTLRPRAGVSALEVELYDGSGRILLIWLGRREIRGVNCGRALVAHGRATSGRDSLVMYNPSYELRPQAHE